MYLTVIEILSSSKGWLSTNPDGHFLEILERTEGAKPKIKSICGWTQTICVNDRFEKNGNQHGGISIKSNKIL